MRDLAFSLTSLPFRALAVARALQAGPRQWSSLQSSVSVPTGLLDAPVELFRVPLVYAQARFTDIVQYHTMRAGGHFFAMEQPAALAADLASFVNTVLSRRDAAARSEL